MIYSLYMNAKERITLPASLRVEFAKLLCQYDIPIDVWGEGQAKTIVHLLEELVKGECQLVEVGGELVRRVSTVAVRVFYNNNGHMLYLKEEKQVFNDGRERRREWLTWSISEKMKRNEPSDKAACRAFEEELRITDDVVLTPLSVTPKQQESSSYPGIMNEFQVHMYEAFLTDDQFNPRGYVEIQDDKTNFWRWVPLHECQ